MEKRGSLSLPGKEGHGVLSVAQNERRTRASSKLTGGVGNLEQCELAMVDGELGWKNY